MISAVVTGAAKGLGREIAARLVEDGVHVVATDIDSAALDRTSAELGALVEPLVADSGDWEAHVRAADAAERSAPLRYWVNNAGIDVQGGAHEVTAEEIERGLRVLQLGPMYGCAVAVRRMLPARAGSIVNITSIQGTHAFPRYFVYQAAKAAVNMITKGVAVDYGPFGIRCNAVLPGTMETPMLDETMRDGYPARGSAAPRGRAGPAGTDRAAGGGRRGRRVPALRSRLVRLRSGDRRRRRHDGAGLRLSAARPRTTVRPRPSAASCTAAALSGRVA